MSTATLEPDTHHGVAASEMVICTIQPGEKAEAILTRTRQWLRLGVKAVWLVYPSSRVIHCYEPGGTIRSFGPGETLDGRPVLPGFKLAVDSIFPSIAPEPN